MAVPSCLSVTLPAMNSVIDQNVPIVGQQIAAEGYTVSVMARCHCRPGGSSVIMSVTCSSAGTTVAVGQCSLCGHAYSIQGIDIDRQARLTFNIAVLSTTPPQDS